MRRLHLYQPHLPIGLATARASEPFPPGPLVLGGRPWDPGTVIDANREARALFDEDLRRAFIKEMELYLDSILRTDASVVDLLTASTRSSTSASRATMACRTCAAISSAASSSTIRTASGCSARAAC